MHEMSLRHTLISTIKKWNELTIDDLAADTGMERKKLHDNLKSVINDGIVERFADDGKPCYRLTTKGQAWLVNRPLAVEAVAETSTKPVEKEMTATKPAKPPKAPKEYLVVKMVIGQFDCLAKARDWAASHASEDSPAVVCEKVAVAKVKREVIWS
jgi:DNA-binding HxlR family transcriptional regulator